MHVFISHSSGNAEEAHKICEYIEARGRKCFIAPRDIRSGREYAEEILDGIDNSDAMILLMSESANHSPHVLREVERAVSKSIPILVYRLEDVELTKSMEYFLMTHQWSEAKTRGDYSEIWEFVCRWRETAADSALKQRMLGDCVISAAEKTSVERRTKGGKRSAILISLLFVLGVCTGFFWLQHGNSEQAVCLSSYETGDTVVFGSYLDQAIEWRILRMSEDGTEAVLVSKNILTMKAFDAAESGTYNQNGEEDYWMKDSLADTDLELQRQVRGNNDWSVSNIRAWLNSMDEVVTYADQPPMVSAMSEKKNGYHNEAGFLCGFTEEEIAAIVPTNNVTPGNGLADGSVSTKDKVYLLSVDELAWFDEAGISKLAMPTQAALEQDASEWYAISIAEYGIEEYSWWLREPVEGTASICYMVGNGYAEENLLEANVGLEGYGIRPAITVDLRAECFVKGE